MSVIAKMSVRKVSQFGTGCMVELSCVCANDLMAAYATSEEDKLFTKYSPWGEMRINQPAGYALGADPDAYNPQASFYVMLLADDEAPEDKGFTGAYAVGRVSCASRTEFAGDSVHVEFRDCGHRHDEPPPGRGIARLNWKMAVDNPGASNQFKPGRDYWIALYPETNFDRDAAIRAAHGHPPVVEAAPAEEGA